MHSHSATISIVSDMSLRQVEATYKAERIDFWEVRSPGPKAAKVLDATVVLDSNQRITSAIKEITNSQDHNDERRGR
jgi:hypothetical protein